MSSLYNIRPKEFPKKCCGIVGYVGNDSCSKYLFEGLMILQNRGYDSAGIASINNNKQLIVTKYASEGSTSDSLKILEGHLNEHQNNTIGIAHTRWATHGSKTNINAHPHCDQHNRIALVHNGVIQNYAEIKTELCKKGIKFISETDSEVIAQLIGYYLDQGESLIGSLKKCEQKMIGTWGVVIVSIAHPNCLFAMKNGSPLLIGIGDNRRFIASEPAAFARYTREFISLKDMEVAVIDASKPIDLSRVEVHPEDNITLSPAPFAHWCIKEITEQPIAASAAMNYGGRFIDTKSVKLGGLESKAEELLPIKNLIISGCGTSYYASMFGCSIMRKLKSFNTVEVIDAAELTLDCLPDEGGMLVVSQSGETKDVHRALQLAQSIDMPTFSVINAVGSLIARTTMCGVYVNAGRENSVASTKSFSSQVICLCLIAVWFSQHRKCISGREQVISSLQRIPTCMGMALTCRPNLQRIAHRLIELNTTSMFILGKGLAESVAKEGALKIKEISYIHAEGYSGGALKHGPFALIEKGLPVILIILDDEHANLMKVAAEEIKARGAYLIVITDRQELACVADEIILICSAGLLTALVAVVPLQILAYELSIAKGINPDKPRNLAKAVTVD
ncbi:glucosamine--fructose-6-phosphate aminotransferase [isomerizing], putative [Entamoeba dispar SAW760]|uniref:Glutamine--fructose-6-phosphate aminotransferase [isomerizing] n=1 Tax=Entamoeba dispar (strain ATCC PRA-260 / SAW760) TaxID=370354 RepID=B0EQI9_ENTDS|nr:glucosamine--fructose-6-phosphate aminotransferase [Entamoeba dispar SAW760]EDR23188.1 glucosamine--fructose-6-phosphate aminotransferase [isomerizing], putative [Entamoeba dispar SAW760]|eukprot:EDR23188.1 glucosamine--fructose-6-phosphate aminotransferase [isomerizing], putative [Entamoeba dispar SAW760]